MSGRDVPADLRACVAGELSPGAVLNRAGWDTNRETWWFQGVWSDLPFEMTVSREEWQDRRLEVIRLRAKFAAPAPEATLGGSRFLLALETSKPGDLSTHVFSAFRNVREERQRIVVAMTDPARLVLEAIASRSQRDGRAYVLFTAIAVLKDRMDTDTINSAEPIDVDGIRPHDERPTAPDPEIRTYIGAKLYQAYQIAGRGVKVRFDWTDLLYLGTTEQEFIRAATLRDGKDWAVNHMVLSPMDDYIERWDEGAPSPQTTVRFEEGASNDERDVFISHASEDKDGIARPLAEALREAGISVWFDEYELVLGDSLRRCIEEGLRVSRHGLVILSHNFFRKEWPQKELDGLFALETDRKKILPVWYGLNVEDVRRYSPILADRVGISAERGIDEIVRAVAAVLQKHRVS